MRPCGCSALRPGQGCSSLPVSAPSSTPDTRHPTPALSRSSSSRMETASFVYLDTPNPNLVCCICRSPFLEPCTARTCSHTFCYECISQAIAINCQCPIDRTPLSLHDLAPADPLIRNLVDELLVQCPQQHLGCTHTSQRLLLPTHLTDTCQFVHVPCPTLSCTRRIMRKDLAEHRCDHAPQDVAEETQKPPKSEPEDVNPSSSSSPDSHTPSSPDMAAENAMLRLRLSALENVVHSLRSEMYAVKHALGPWYRPETQSQIIIPQHLLSSLATTSQTTEQTLAEVEGAQRTNDTPLLPPGDPSDIASYFPTPDEATLRGPNGDGHPHLSRTRATTDASLPPAGRAQASTSPNPYPAFPSSPAVAFGPSAMYTTGLYATPGSAPGASLPPGTAPAANSSATIVSVPPLDPTVPLPDTLATLHSSLVTLAGSLGALAAARGSESLRTAEEIRGMRAVMHGLRMQMHEILTSRTYVPGQGSTGPMGGSADLDASDGAAPLGMGVAHWPGYLPRLYGQLPLYHHPYSSPHPGMTHAPPTNITKLITGLLGSKSVHRSVLSAVSTG
ncbi:hypothetical protein BC628DRAFT_1358333 [Trametes gibbosa]|nr:hypothetical protein BC628DRAFT_1358333 [Trametes gibbosa]